LGGQLSAVSFQRSAFSGHLSAISLQCRVPSPEKAACPEAVFRVAIFPSKKACSRKDCHPEHDIRPGVALRAPRNDGEWKWASCPEVCHPGRDIRPGGRRSLPRAARRGYRGALLAMTVSGSGCPVCRRAEMLHATSLRQDEGASPGEKALPRRAGQFMNCPYGHSVELDGGI
jgi:hypothetical protein